jgi:hypothetical protein
MYFFCNYFGFIITYTSLDIFKKTKRTLKTSARVGVLRLEQLP